MIGDKTLVKPGLERLDYEIIELDKEGNPVTATTVPAPAKAGSSSDNAPARKKTE